MFVDVKEEDGRGGVGVYATPTLILNPNQTYLINKRSSVFIANSLSVIKHF